MTGDPGAAQPQVLRAFRVGDEQLELRVGAAGRLTLRRGSDGAFVNLGAEEASTLLNTDENDLGIVDVLGLDFELRGGAEPERTRRQMLVEQLSGLGSCVLLDTSTLGSAQLCLEGQYVSPTTLLELNLLTCAAVLYDRVVYQPGSRFDVPIDLTESFYELRYPDEFIPETLWSMCASIYNAMSEAESGEFAAAWSGALNLDPASVRIDVLVADQLQDSPLYWNGVFAGMYFESLMPPAGLDPADVRQQNEFLSVQTMRTMFNDRLAGYLGVPYLASSMRAAPHAVLLRRKIERQSVVDRIVSGLGPAPAGDEITPAAYSETFSAPYLLGLVLRRMERPDDYWRVVAELRERAQPLRERLSRDAEYWNRAPGHYVAELLRPLRDLSPTYAGTISGAAVAVGAISSAVRPDTMAVQLSVKLARLMLPPETLRLITYKLFRPQLYVLLSLHEEARNLRVVEDQVEAIWGSRWSRPQHDLLARLAASQPNDFARLRRV